ncbi:hypothetical protein EFT87_12975 [Schleiferilactobacillus harbinensis]|uniref:hypothetical protein n=1 Tax=Schleiferilactobacillus harbinensis TaxID=304207 RepID=UPI0021A4B470|nr:hypothetical protein [Schleiferilactobacillus harbinensis]MCT2909564.1 hypothetical protein [Schleiferilactobacillus harbinensis]
MADVVKTVSPNRDVQAAQIADNDEYLKDKLSLAYASLAPKKKMEKEIGEHKNNIADRINSVQDLKTIAIGGGISFLIVMFLLVKLDWTSVGVSFIVSLIVGGALGLFINNSARDGRNLDSLYKNQFAGKDATVVAEEKAIQKLESQLQTITTDNGYLEAVGFVPKKYRTVNDLGWLFTYIDDGRADSLKESINVYEQEKHNYRMESMQQDILSSSQQAAINAAAARSAAEDASANSAAAMYTSWM